MNWSDLPSLNALRAFLALAQCQSFSDAGKLLNVTHAAVSQQVRNLETRLGVRLVARDGRRVRLTPEGRDLARELASGFDTIKRAVENLVESDDNRPVQVTMSPAFAVSWLLPRSVDFQSRHPDVTLLLNPTSKIVDLRTGGTDVAIRYSDAMHVPEGADRLLTVDMVVVGTPELVGTRKPNAPRSLLDLPWLQELGTNEVSDWLARRGVTLHHTLAVSHMPGNLIMEAVRRGDGLTYTVRPFVAEDIRAGSLIELYREPAFGVFRMVTQPGVLRPAVKSFVRWLRIQAQADNDQSR